jgi:fatty-acyl-CoA synthase
LTVYPGHYAQESPNKAAAISARTGEVITYAELDARSNRLAQLLWADGLRRGDHIAVFLENHLRYFEIAWAAFRSGLYLTTVNRYLTAPEASYIVDDCGAQVLVSSRALHDVAAAIPELAPGCRRVLVVDGPPPGASDRFESYEKAVDEHPAAPLDEEPLGEFMLYSSGTTGQPKGITRPLSRHSVSRGLTLNAVLKGLFRVDASSVYLSPAPLYHSAPIGFCTAMQSLGGTVVMMDRFARLGEVLDHPQPVGAHHVHTAAEAPEKGTLRLRSLPSPSRDPRCCSLPAEGEGRDVRMVGTDPPRVLWRNRAEWTDLRRAGKMAGASRNCRARGDGQDPCLR